jgi:hypothetical protein
MASGSVPSIAEIPTWHRDGGKEKIQRPKVAAPPEEVSSWKTEKQVVAAAEAFHWSTRSLTFYGSYPKGSPHISCPRISGGKAFICREAWTSNGSDQESGQPGFALFLPAR